MDMCFCIRASEKEHLHIEDELRQRCALHLCKVDYYRHVQDTYKEVRITGNRDDILHVKNFLQGGMNIRFVKNPKQKVKENG